MRAFEAFVELGYTDNAVAVATHPHSFWLCHQVTLTKSLSE